MHFVSLLCTSPLFVFFVKNIYMPQISVYQSVICFLYIYIVSLRIIILIVSSLILMEMLYLHYCLYWFLFWISLKGCVKAVGRIIFNTEVDIELLSHDQAEYCGILKEHYKFHVCFVKFDLAPMGTSGIVTEEVNIESPTIFNQFALECIRFSMNILVILVLLCRCAHAWVRVCMCVCVRVLVSACVCVVGVRARYINNLNQTFVHPTTLLQFHMNAILQMAISCLFYCFLLYLTDFEFGERNENLSFFNVKWVPSFFAQFYYIDVTVGKNNNNDRGQLRKMNIMIYIYFLFFLGMDLHCWWDLASHRWGWLSSTKQRIGEE